MVVKGIFPNHTSTFCRRNLEADFFFYFKKAFSSLFCCCLYETGFESVIQTGLEFVAILLSQSSQCWDYTHELLCLESRHFLPTESCTEQGPGHTPSCPEAGLCLCQKSLSRAPGRRQFQKTILLLALVFHLQNNSLKIEWAKASIGLPAQLEQIWTQLSGQNRRKKESFPLSRHLSWLGIEAPCAGAQVTFVLSYWQCLDKDCCLNLCGLPILCDNLSKRGRLGADIRKKIFWNRAQEEETQGCPP